MQLIKNFMKIFIGCMMIVNLTSAYAASDPVALLNSVAQSMLNGLQKNQATLKSHPGIVYALAKKNIVPHAALDAMAMKVLPRNTWQQATTSERNAFKKGFTITLIRTYAAALASYQNETVKFFPVRGGYENKNMIDVNSDIVRNNGPAINVSYRLIKISGSWKLLDLTVEGISMLESFRSQFADQLRRGNMQELLRVLAQHNTAND